MFDDNDKNTIYEVVINHEEQYSIWPKKRDIPKGWKAIGFHGTKQQCLARIEEVWTDMRPLTLRKHMEEMARLAREQD